MAKQRVVVLFGGASKDYDVSLQSAYAVICGLGRDKYEVHPVGITRAGRWLYFPGNIEEIKNKTWEANSDCCSAILSPDPHHGGLIKILGDGSTSMSRIDVIFSVLHGKYGECGRIQSLCKLTGVAFVGSDYDASNACSDKMLTHLILDKAGIATPRYHYIERTNIDRLDAVLPDIEADLGYPVYVKAASCSASIGANLAADREQLTAALKLAFSHHHKAIVEEALSGRDLECYVIGSAYSLEVSEIGEIIPIDEEKTKFVVKTATFQVANIPSDVKETIRQMAKLSFQVLGCKTLARFRFKLTDKGLFICSAGNIPGMSEKSIFPAMMLESGYSYSALLDLLIEYAVDARL